MNDNITIAIDGVSGSGKSTMARTLAKKYGFLYVDSGAMYRAVTYYAIQHHYLSDGELLKNVLSADLNKIDISFAKDGHTILNGQDVEKEIRSMDVAAGVSLVAAVPEVRMAMVMLQRAISAHNSVVMDGRDIGTVVFPNANVKLFVTSDPKVRAQRRLDELKAKGTEVDFESVLKNIVERDRIDSTREVSPLTKADDAIELDNSYMSIEEQNAILDKIISETLAKKTSK
ncbi:MAG: (d)CMP kinase [Flavobacteriales bacterium]|nr:(d)CMP kinase [Flavobacteriales bacterium]